MITIKFYGGLYWYTKLKEPVVQLHVSTPCEIKEILGRFNIPSTEVFFVVVNGIKVNKDDFVSSGDVLEIYPVVGGG